ncbi:hypothetical protein HN51_019108 [Arachis hypogaea]|uniref:methyl-CpG-binding domain-containing protein 7 n=1 Tax=Arachis hypogaea TaxID=3818 RepID=UPI000DEC6192|nr:methyl-CpG-binding domain-containing protein 7 [Arachis hypogaea]XP_025613945.1 methyl-CpG-binding domain-containing protein 7 [Arachis hypogaea]QHO30666.1 Methyl-CpG-binding domain-containing protein [Arachis hypogaea]
MAMATRKSLRKRRNVLAEEEEDDEEKREMEMQIVCFSPRQYQHPFTLPQGWIIERKPRLANPTIVDKYYHEPGTGKKFRSLVAVQRYLLEPQTTEFHAISHHQNTSGTGTEKQRFRSLRNVERCLSGQTASACTDTLKGPPTPTKLAHSLMKSATANQSDCGFTTYRRVMQHKATPEPLRCSFPSTHADKSDSRNKFGSGKDNRSYIHNLPPPPEKVTWVLSGPGGFWSPSVNDSVVAESEKLKWSEAFVLSIHNKR